MALFERLKQVFRSPGRHISPQQHAQVVAQHNRLVQRHKTVLARYDAEMHTLDNARHWAMADNLSPAMMVNESTRSILRRRSRYELANNSWAWGMVNRKTVDVIGRGPRLQFQWDDREANQELERQWQLWSNEIDLAQLLSTAYQSRIMSGESFLMPKTNSRLSHAVKMTLHLLETDQVSTPDVSTPTSLGFGDFDPTITDGVIYDEQLNVRAYTVLKAHPGSGAWTWNEFDIVPVEQMVHLFRPYRPNQPRGIPEATAALPLFAYLRRFTLATVAAAEIAASYAGVLQTTGGAVVDLETQQLWEDDSGNPLPYAPINEFDTESITRGMMTALPAGWSLQQLQAQNPNTTYEMFVHELTTELARCFQIPFFRAVGRAKEYTYASGKLDNDAYLDVIANERHHLQVTALQKILTWWWDEAALTGIIPPGMPPLTELPYRWIWDAHRETDPLKHAQAISLMWDKGLLSSQDIWYELGLDPETMWQKLAGDIQERKEMEAPLPGRSAILPEPDFGDGGQTAAPSAQPDEQQQEEDAAQGA